MRPGPGLYRGCINALPISIILWLLIIIAGRFIWLAFA